MTQETIIIKKMQELGRTLVGVATIDYPVYVIHLELKRPNNDPMYFIDWAIVHFIESQPNLDKQVVAWTLGVESSLIEYRTRYLCENVFLKVQNMEYEILPKARNFYFTDSGEVPLVNDSKDLLVDGVSFQLMDPKLYEEYPFVRYDKNGIITRTPVKNGDDYGIKKVLDKIERMTDTNKEKYGLPSKSEDYVSSGMPSEGIVSLSVVFSIDGQGMPHKEVMYGADLINVPSLNRDGESNYLRKCCFFFNKDLVSKNNCGLVFNNGTNSREANEAARQILNLKDIDIQALCQQIFGWEDAKNREDYIYFYDEYRPFERPLSLYISYDRFCQSENRRAIVNAIKNEYIRYPRDSRGFFIYITVYCKDERLSNLLEFDELIDGYVKDNNLEGLMLYFNEHGSVECRRKTIILQRFDVLENMDIDNFIREE